MQRLTLATTLALAAFGTLVAQPGCSNDGRGLAGLPCSPSGNGGTCSAATTCDPSAHICTCPDGFALCGADCVDVSRTAAHCGACGLACPSGETCTNGRCSGGRCASGAADCGGRCVDPRTDVQHCGGCNNAGGRSCGDGALCANGACQLVPCAYGQSLCGNACVNLSSSPSHCGACGRACGQGEVCSAGVCAKSCASGLTLCGSACVDTRKDPDHCGGCNEVCSQGEICGREGGETKCRDYRFAACNTCPCRACGERSCCRLPSANGYEVLCVEDQCPVP